MKKVKFYKRLNLKDKILWLDQSGKKTSPKYKINNYLDFWAWTKRLKLQLTFGSNVDRCSLVGR